MDLQFLSSRNGQETCSADGRYLHSSFNPQNEAQRFIESIPCPFEPSAVVVLGACLPWCAGPLRARFPKARLISVQYDARFSGHSAGWDDVFFVTNAQDAAAFSNALFTMLGEEKLMVTQFISWKASESVWPDENRASWEAIKSCMEKAQSVLTTRNHFNKAWFRNTVRNLSLIKTYALPEKTDLPFVVTASGPSLMKALPFIKENRQKFRLMAASSSLSTLMANDIVPDFTISTDGGWYAMRHLRSYETDSRLKEVPLIISAESAVPAACLESVPVMLLTYGDGMETVIAQELGTPSVHGLRNGTVSGTAAALALELTSGPVYMCGLDLAPGKGFQHAEPNENDVPLFTGQSRIKTLETSQAGSRFSGGSLALYRDWFMHQNEAFNSRIIRVVSETEPLEPLGAIQDIAVEKLKLPETKTQKQQAYRMQKAAAGSDEAIKTYLTSVMTYIEKHPEDEKCSLWYASTVLEKYIYYLRMSSENRLKELPLLAKAAVTEIGSLAEIR